MPLPGEELSAINFESVIGGPLTAVIRAQSQAALASADFIRSVGFKPVDPNDATKGIEPVMVTFSYKRDITTVENGAEVTTPTKHELTVPILTMLPVPFIRIEEATIDFNAKIVSTEYSDTSTKLGVDAELKAQASWGWGSASLKVNVSYQKTTNTGSKVERNYSMGVKVRAVQDEMPPGTERLLAILENVIKEKKAEE